MQQQMVCKHVRIKFAHRDTNGQQQYTCNTKWSAENCKPNTSDIHVKIHTTNKNMSNHSKCRKLSHTLRDKSLKPNNRKWVSHPLWKSIETQKSHPPSKIAEPYRSNRQTNKFHNTRDTNRTPPPITPPSSVDLTTQTWGPKSGKENTDILGIWGDLGIENGIIDTTVDPEHPGHLHQYPCLYLRRWRCHRHQQPC